MKSFPQHLAIAIALLSFQAAQGAPLILDMRDHTENPTSVVAFVARSQSGDSKVGHCFVLVGTVKDPADLQKSELLPKLLPSKGEGFSPTRGGKRALHGPVEGQVITDILRATDNVAMIVLVNTDAVKAVVEVRKKWATPSCPEGEYALVWKDCCSYLGAVAKAIGVKVPKRDLASLTPVQFVQSLRQLNEKE